MSSITSAPHISSRNDNRTTSLVERSFVRQNALAKTRPIRSDGRQWKEWRPQRVHLVRSDNVAHATIQWGAGSLVTCACTAQLIPPSPDRPQEGTVSLSVDASPGASTSFRNVPPVSTTSTTTQRTNNNSSTVNMEESQKAWTNRILRALERILLTGGALDSEALCVTPEEWVWKLELNIVLLDAAGGNLMDASIWAAMAALRHYRKPCLDLSDPTGTPVMIESHIKEPTPLPLHHTPLALSFAILTTEDTLKGSLTSTSTTTSSSFIHPQQTTTDNNYHHHHHLPMVALVDPTYQEELVADGSLITIAMNVHGEICLVDYAGGCEVEPALFRTVCQTAQQILQKEWCPTLEQSLYEADEQALRERLQQFQLRQQQQQQQVNNTTSTNDSTDTKMEWETSHTPATTIGMNVDIDMTMEQTHDVATTAADEEEETAEAEAEAAYQRQALDYNIGHLPTAIRETKKTQQQQQQQVNKKKQHQANALLQSLLLQSAAKDEEAAKQENANLGTEIGVMEHEITSLTEKQTKDDNNHESAKDDNNDDDDDEEETPIVLKSEFATVGVPPTRKDDDISKNDGGDNDIDDLVGAIRKKKKTKKQKK